MQVQLTGKAAEIVNAKVVAGEYPNAAAFISDLVLRAEEFDQIKRASTTALLSEQALAVDWNRPEEDEAWAHLQRTR